MYSSLTCSATALLLALSPSRVSAWGTLGHETIAWMAQGYVSSTTKASIQSILGSKASDYMANVSTWADSYRYTSAGSWSKPLHFIDANDNPPSSCSVDYDRDCGSSGCSISAIVNYTSIILASQSSSSSQASTILTPTIAISNDTSSSNTTSLTLSSSSTELTDAMKFLIHFIGDLHQPLHDEALDVGGNDINVTYGSESTNLHHIWDTEIPEELADGMTAEAFASNLSAAIANADFGWDSAAWIKGMSLNDTEGTALGWAQEANAFVCSDVLAAGVAAVEEGDLSGAYYKAHVDVARTQIARAGFRLGAWLNLIVTGSTSG